MVENARGKFKLRTVIFLFSLLWALLLLIPAALSRADAVVDIQLKHETASEAVITVQPTETAPVTAALFTVDETDKANEQTETAAAAPSTTIKLLSAERGFERELTLEEYVRCVLWAELPLSFSDEAWKAQAVAIRTYAVYHMENGLPLYDDSARCCAYYNDTAAQERFGNAFDAIKEKAVRAVSETAGELLYYDGEAACTVFHAMSYETTASAESVWGGVVPYLASVSTPEGERLEGMTVQYTFDEKTLCRLLGTACALPLQVSRDANGRIGTVVTADGSRFSGTAFRSALHLRSTMISVNMQDGDSLLLSVKGYGHGVGMSQWGAHLMAENGESYKGILAHYYPGTEMGDGG